MLTGSICKPRQVYSFAHDDCPSDLAVNLGRCLRHAPVGEVTCLPPASRSAQRLRIDFAVQDAADLPGQIVRVAGLRQQTVNAVANHLRHAFHARGHHRNPSGHGLENHHRHAFAEQARQHEQVHAGQFGGNVAGKADPSDMLAKLQAIHLLANRPLVGCGFKRAHRP